MNEIIKYFVRSASMRVPKPLMETKEDKEEGKNTNNKTDIVLLVSSR